MDEPARELAREIRAMSSEDAASFMLSEAREDESRKRLALKVIASRSWKPQDQHRLAEYFLQGVIAANPGFYAMFLKFMSVKNFTQHIRASTYAPKDIRLLLYHLTQELRAATKNETDKRRADDLIDELQQRQSLDETTGRRL